MRALYILHKRQTLCILRKRCTSCASIVHPVRALYILRKRYLRSKYILCDREPSPAALCSGLVRSAPRYVATMAYASLCLETPLPIRQMITGVTEMTRGNCITVEDANTWAHFDMKKKNKVKRYALQEYIAKANMNVIQLFFDTWQAFWAKLFDT